MKTKKKRLILSGLLLLLLLFPLKTWAREFPQPTGFVNDFAGLFSPGFRQKLEIDLQEFEKETSVELVVVTVKTLGDSSIEDYAVRLFENWQIGKRDKNNGILLLIAPQERQMRIEVGYGLEPIITDGRAGRIIRKKIRPAFRNGDYEGGVRAGVEEIKKYVRTGEPPARGERMVEKINSTLPLLIFGGVILIYFSSFFARSKRFWPGGMVGGLIGGFLGLMVGSMIGFVFLLGGLAIFGLLLDYFLSRNYQKLKAAGRPTGFFSTWGGFSSGGGGFGGFGGGSSGGGGASGRW